MIKRYYFVSTQCYRNDGSGSYSYDSRAFFIKSIFAKKPTKVLETILEDIKETYIKKGLPVGNISVLSFNKI